MEIPCRFTVVADDLTGACDTGAAFAGQGLRTLVWLSPAAGGELPPSDVLVVSTESRQLQQEEAVAAIEACVRQIAQWFTGQDSFLIYKKIDSTLRGHPAAELAALMRALRIDRALVAPAFPAQGRTTAGGRQWVNGIPIEQTVFGREGADSDLRAVFSPCADLVSVRLIELAAVHRGAEHAAGIMSTVDPAVWIGDAETDADLRALAQAAALSHIRLLCGSAGLARAMMHNLMNSPYPLGELQPMTSPHPQIRTSSGAHAHPWMRTPSAAVLVVAGSRNPATVRQVDAAERAGFAVLRPPPSFVHVQDSAIECSVMERAARVLSSGRPLILAVSGLPESPYGTAFVARRLALVAARLVERASVAGLVLSGGDVASAVCDALGTTMLWLIGEVGPGIAAGSLIGGARPGLPVVTKAGGFGEDDALSAAIGYLSAD